MRSRTMDSSVDCESSGADADEVRWTRPPSVISTLDSVLWHLDDLLSREGSAGTTLNLEPCPSDNQLADVQLSVAAAPLVPSKSSSLCGAEELRRVMDLSFASVYEMQSGTEVDVDVDSGVETKSDVSDGEMLADYENIVHVQPEAASPSKHSTAHDRSRPDRKDKNKFYEITLGHLCHQFHLVEDRRISIFSIHKNANHSSVC